MPDHDRGPSQELALPPQQQFIALLLPAIQAAREGSVDTFEFEVTGSPPGNSSDTPYTLTIMGTLLTSPVGDETPRGVQSDVTVEHDGDSRLFKHDYSFSIPTVGVQVHLEIEAVFDFG